MKKFVCIILLSFVFLSVFAKTVYIAPSTASPAGSNSNSGTISSPWLSLTYAWDRVSAGDTIYVRGGTYTYAMVGESYLDNKNGTSSNYIYVLNYPGESPVFDFSAYLTTTYRRGIRIDNADYVYIRGIEVKNLRQAADGQSTNTGLYITNDVNHVIVENMNIHHIGGWGLQFGTCTYIDFVNSDFHHCSDPNSTGSSRAWDGGDGVQSASSAVSNITFTGCRFYKNGDDGVDLLWVGGHVTFDHCWSFQNGYRPGATDADADYMSTAGGNGEGFKLGMKRIPDVSTILRTVNHCVAAQNRLLGFHHYVDAADEYEFSVEIYNNTAYNNGVSGYDGGGFNFGNMTVATDILRNNLCYNDQVFVNAVHSSTYNSWNTPPGVTLSSADFVNLNYSELETARNADHSLPSIGFMNLVEGSDCINAGVDVGFSYVGSAPDLGAFEYGTEEEEPEPEDPYSSTSLGRYNKFNGKYLKHNGKYIKW